MKRIPKGKLKVLETIKKEKGKGSEKYKWKKALYKSVLKEISKCTLCEDVSKGNIEEQI